MTETAHCLQRLLAANLPALPEAPEVMAEAAAACRVRRLAADATLFAQGAPATALYGVVDGELAARFCGFDGSLTVIEHLQPPRLFGLAALAGGRPSSYEAVAVGACRVLVIGAAAYALLMDRRPGFGRALMGEFARRHDSTLRLLQASRQQPAAERLALALAQLLRQRGAAARDGRRRLLQASQAELAQLAGLSRQTVNQELRRLAQGGRLQPVYGGLWLDDDLLPASV